LNGSFVSRPTRQAFRLSPIELPPDCPALPRLVFDGNGNNIFMNSVYDDTIMITVFGRRTTVGLVRFYSSSTAQADAGLLTSLQRNCHDIAFDAADVTATPIFSDN
jgi:hypothetical protein